VILSEPAQALRRDLEQRLARKLAQPAPAGDPRVLTTPDGRRVMAPMATLAADPDADLEETSSAC
jgi:hypothetical protein